jgi:esterase/lipase
MEQGYAVNDYDYRRTHERKKYPAEIVFHHVNRLYAGSLIDISLGGAFIETYCVNQFSTKDIVTLSIPFSSGQKNVKRRGCVKWLNNAGFAVEFI